INTAQTLFNSYVSRERSQLMLWSSVKIGNKTIVSRALTLTQVVNMKVSYTITLCFAGLLMASPAMAAKVYKWVDENGLTNFSEHPPRNTKAEVLTPKIGHSEPVTYDTHQGQPEAEEEPSTEPKS